MGKRYKLGDLVMVEWDDSRQPAASWAWLEDYPFQESSKNVTVGWLVKDGKDAYSVAQSLGDVDKESPQVGGLALVAKSAVKRVKVLISSSFCPCQALASKPKRKQP